IKNENYKFFLMQGDKDIFEGFFSFVPKDGGIFLSKIYIRENCRGKGYARKSISFIKDAALKAKLKHITLTVNKNNKDSIAAYKKMGFKIESSATADIGNNFVMDDYIMKLKI
ncbi:MAG: GNAT family N-acetyltransferase, partial [Elusimicrobiota bacterium]|nr:GNAT family N-acetyltransferase [Elusimicrobiota bacterium]